MILVIVLLLFNPVFSNLEKGPSCSHQSCSNTDSQHCVRVKKLNQNTIFVVVPNQCELHRLQCSEGIEATVVSMNSCYPDKNINNERMEKKRTKRQTQDYLPARVITDNNEREMGFMIDIDMSTEHRPIIQAAVHKIAWEAVKEQSTTFYAFSTYMDNLWTTNHFKGAKDFLKEFRYFANTKGVDKDDCQKNMLQQIGRAIKPTFNTTWRANNNNSYLYVFAHNLAKDYELAKTWTQTDVKITIILVPECLDRQVRGKPEFQAYYDIATKTGGLMFRLSDIKDVGKLVDYVRLTALAFEPKLLLSQMKPHGSYIPIRVKKSVAYVLVTVCGSNVDFTITDDWGNRIRSEFIINRAHTKVYRFVALPPHTYEIKLEPSIYAYGKLNVTVNVQTSQVNFTFQYRVSKKKKWRHSLRDKDDSRKPKYLIVKVTDKRNLVDVKKIKFIDLQNGVEDIFASFTLVEIADNLYATVHKIVMPTHNFFMVVSGFLKGTTKELDSREVLYKPSEDGNELSSSEDAGDSKPKRTTTRVRTTRPTFKTSTCSMWPESRLFDNADNNTIGNLTLLRWKKYRASCPKQCPVRDVMVCARCQHGVHTTFMSDCHMRMFQCQHPEDKLVLIARKPCVYLPPYLGNMRRPTENMGEPKDKDLVMSHILDKF